MIIDTHSHIYGPEFADDAQIMLERASSAGVIHHILANVDVSTINPMRTFHSQYPSLTSMAMGLHPTEVRDDCRSQLAVIERALVDDDYVAIGEIGLDLYWDASHLQEQLVAFEIQLKWASEMNIPVILHIRKAYAETFQLLHRLRLSNLKGVMHCFSGGIEEAKKAVDLGFLLGIGGVVTYKNSGLVPIIQQIGIENLLLETDAPYLSPVPNRGKRNEPENLQYVVRQIASVLQIKSENVEKITTENALKLFKID